MELKVFDQDLVTKDDPVLSVLFDVGTLRVGTQRESFSLSTQVKLGGGVGEVAPPCPVLGAELWRLPCSWERPRNPK